MFLPSLVDAIPTLRVGDMQPDDLVVRVATGLLVCDIGLTE
jgi:hypothetical protein